MTEGAPGGSEGAPPPAPSMPPPAPGTPPAAPAPPAAPPAPTPPPVAPPDPEDEGDGEGEGDDESQTPLAVERRARRRAQARSRQLEGEVAQLRTENATVVTLRRALLEQTIIATATGQLADPGDAIRLLDLGDIKVGADGKIDVEAIRAKVTALVQSKPYLANGHGQPARPPALPGGGGLPAPGGRDFNTLLRQAAGIAPRP